MKKEFFQKVPVHFNGNNDCIEVLQKGGDEFFTCYGSHPGIASPMTKESWLRHRLEVRDTVSRIREAEQDSSEQKELKRRLPFWTPHCSLFKDNKRQMGNAQQPLMRVMEDYDQDKGRSREIMEKALALEKEGKWKILLVEESPRGGTHVLHNIPKGMTAWEASREFSDAIGELPDLSVVSLEHFIYMVSDQQTLYVSDELFEGYDPASGANEAWDSSKRFSNK